MRRFWLGTVFPSWLLLGVCVLPLAWGTHTLYSRDVLHSHFPLKVAQAQALRAGELPLVDRERGGGQPLVGNLNAVPLYPDNLLYLLAPTLWALNAHFWLHWLIAPLAGYWLGRAWGLGPLAAWIGGMVYATSGFFLSQLNLYNLVAGAALTPALIAACLEAGTRRGRLLAVGLLWALLLLAGDPFFAGLALGMAGLATLIQRGFRPTEWLRLGLALLLGTAVAAPQLVEIVRILPLSYRGYWQYSPEAALAQGFDPRSAFEWLLPLSFGRPDFSFWGREFYGGNEPLFYSLYPGLLTLLLLGVAGVHERRTRLAWGFVIVGGLLALGALNPVVRWLYQLPGLATLRYPIKFWLLVAVGTALLAATGSERWLAGERPRTLPIGLGVGLVLYAGAWVGLSFGTNAWLSGVLPPAVQDAERTRWAGLCLLSCVELCLLAFAVRWRPHRPQLAATLVVLIHAAAQLLFLRPLRDTDVVTPYTEPPRLLAAVPSSARLVHGGFQDLFGQRYGRIGPYPDSRTLWLTRQHFADLYPFSGIQWGRRYDFNPSPEGLDTFFQIALIRRCQQLQDPERLRLLAASGVDILLLDRELDPAALPLVHALPPPGTPGETAGETAGTRIYALNAPAAPVQLVGTVLRAPHLNAAVAALADPAFNPRTMVVLPGDGPRVDRPPGTISIHADERERLVVDTTSPEGGVLLIQRSYLELYRAQVDGLPQPIEVANVQRIGVTVPPGAHRVELWVDRRPTRVAWVVAMVAALGLLQLACFPRRTA